MPLPKSMWPSDLENAGLFWGTALARLKAAIEAGTASQPGPQPETDDACHFSEFRVGRDFVADEVSIEAAAVRLNRVMKFLVVSHRGTVSVPDEELAENRREWGVWMETLDEQSGLRPRAGKTISADGIADYAGDSAGVSIIQASSLDEALARVRSCPGLPYGWAFDVLYE